MKIYSSESSRGDIPGTEEAARRLGFAERIERVPGFGVSNPVNSQRPLRFRLSGNGAQPMVRPREIAVGDSILNTYLCGVIRTPDGGLNSLVYAYATNGTETKAGYFFTPVAQYGDPRGPNAARMLMHDPFNAARDEVYNPVYEVAGNDQWGVSIRADRNTDNSVSFTIMQRGGNETDYTGVWLTGDPTAQEADTKVSHTEWSPTEYIIGTWHLAETQQAVGAAALRNGAQ